MFSRESTYYVKLEGKVKWNYCWRGIYHVLGTCVFSSSPYDNPERCLFLFSWLLVMRNLRLGDVKSCAEDTQWDNGDFNQVSLTPTHLHFLLSTEFPDKNMGLVKSGRRRSCHESTKLFESDVEGRREGKLEVTLPSKRKKSVGSVLQTQDNQNQLIEIKECFGKGRAS